MATSRHHIRSFLLRSIATSKTHSYFSALINSEKTSISHLRHFTNIYSTVARNDSVQKVSKFREPKIHLLSSFSTSSFSSQLAEEDSYVLDWETTTTTKTTITFTKVTRSLYIVTNLGQLPFMLFT